MPRNHKLGAKEKLSSDRTPAHSVSTDLRSESRDFVLGGSRRVPRNED